MRKKSDIRYIENIKSQYPSLSLWSDHYSIQLYQSILNEQIITEFTYTVSPSKTIPNVRKRIRTDKISIPTTDDKVSSIKVTFSLLEKDIVEEVNRVMDAFGWFPASIVKIGVGVEKYSPSLSPFLGMRSVIIVYEAKYDMEVNVKRYAYHVTPDINWNKISVIGLTPKNQEKISAHPERIYLSHNITIDELKKLAITLWLKSKNKDLIKEMCILRVDIKTLDKHIFFNDPNFIGKGIWTYQNIPPSAITVRDTVKV